jgi:flagella basal body P-ring formation protein FlgA
VIAMLPTLVLAFAFAAPQGIPPQIEILATAKAPGTRVLLRDLVANASAAGVEASLLDLDLGRAPSPGFERVIDRKLIESLAPGVRFHGAELTAIRSSTVTIEREAIEEAARSALATAGIPETTTLEVTRAPLAITVAEGRQSRRLVPRLRGQIASRGPLTVQVDVEVDGKLERTAQVLFMARSHRAVPVLVRDLARGETLAREHVHEIVLDVTDLTVPEIDVESLLGTETRRELRAGSPLKAPDFAPKTLIRRGEPIRIRLASGGLTLEGRGVAKEDGALGDRIRIENADSRRALIGRVAATGLVIIES